MKKKNLAIILILPFILSLLGVATVKVTLKTFHHDISYIEWNYNDVEAFKLVEGKKYPLHATGVNTSNYPLSEGNDLVWSSSDPTIAEVVKEEDGYVLYTLAEGRVTITCANEKGNVSRRMTGVVYENGAILAMTQVQSSQNNIDDTTYFGMYDLVNGQKQPAQVPFTIQCIPNSMQSSLELVETSANVQFDVASSTLTITAPGEAHFTLSANMSGATLRETYSFTVVDQGINVYTYDDLLYCTNRSTSGEVVVLRKSFEAIHNVYNCDEYGKPILSNGKMTRRAGNNVELFGNYNPTTQQYTFASEVHPFTTTYNNEYIKQWNQFASKNSKYRTISNKVYAGLHVQKDFYGNGYTLNFHNLTYPYARHEVGGQIVPKLNEQNVFRGPLPFYTLGDPNNLPLISAFGQDNIGMYVDGVNATINDVNLVGCDFGSSITNLDTVGNVMEIAADNVTLKNSVLKNGKNIVRCFSAQGVKIENSLLANSRNFLLTVGCNEFIPVKDETARTLYTGDGAAVNENLKTYLSVPEKPSLLGATSAGDILMTQYLLNAVEEQTAKKALQALQDALNADADSVKTDYRGSLTVSDTLFYKSGITPIALESYFNGPFLYSAAPSIIGALFGQHQPEGKPIAPLLPTKLSGTSYPFYLTLSGATKFYDYKTTDEMDLSGLISENISVVTQDIFGEAKNVDIEDIFPIKSLLYTQAAKTAALHSANGKQYLNVPIAFYGGAVNNSVVNTDNLDVPISVSIAPDWITHFLKMEQGDGSTNVDITDTAFVKSLMQRTVTAVAGFDPFRFECVGNGVLFGEKPDVSQLRNQHVRNE